MSTTLDEISGRTNKILNFLILIESQNEFIIKNMKNMCSDEDGKEIDKILNGYQELKQEILSGMHEDPLSPVD